MSRRCNTLAPNAVRTVNATSAIRKMRGCCQSYLLQADDGRKYVVKFADNPQFGRRALVNEFIGATLFRALGVTTPDIAFVDVTAEFLSKTPELHVTERGHMRKVSPGLHFGSVYLEWPLLYDFLPDRLLTSVVNAEDFFGALVLDKWLGNADGRQTIFYPTVNLHRGLGGLRWVVSMIDHGALFGGDAWSFSDSAPQGLYGRLQVYRTTNGPRPLAPWIRRLRQLQPAALNDAISQLPPSWLAGDEDAVKKLVERLWERRERLPDLIAASLQWLEAKRSRAYFRREPVGVMHSLAQCQSDKHAGHIQDRDERVEPWKEGSIEPR
jgi:hypothetical protein